MYIYIYIYMHIYIYIYIFSYLFIYNMFFGAQVCPSTFPMPIRMHARTHIWLRTSGVNTNGAGAKVMTNFDRLEKKVRPGTLGEIKIG